MEAWGQRVRSSQVVIDEYEAGEGEGGGIFCIERRVGPIWCGSSVVEGRMKIVAVPSSLVKRVGNDAPLYDTSCLCV